MSQSFILKINVLSKASQVVGFTGSLYTDGIQQRNEKKIGNDTGLAYPKKNHYKSWVIGMNGSILGIKIVQKIMGMIGERTDESLILIQAEHSNTHVFGLETRTKH